MPKPATRDLPVPLRDRLVRLLDAPQLARVVPHLAPETLHQLIGYRGLDACAELLPLATPEQLASVLDLDLWRPAEPSADERFDPVRFCEWIETLVEADDTAAARIVAGMDARIVTAGLSCFVRVLDPGVFARPWDMDDEAVDDDSGPFSGLAAGIGGYIVQARRADAWDSIVTLLVALEAGHGEFFHAVMGGCRRLSNSAPETDGLDRLLRDPAQLMHDAAVEREARRSEQGYLTPAEARAFLQTCRQPAAADGDRTSSSSSANPIAAAYLATQDRAGEPVPPGDAQPGPAPSSGGSLWGRRLACLARAGRPRHEDPAEAVEAAAALTELLAEAGVVPGSSSRRLLQAPAGPGHRPARMPALLEEVRLANEAAYAARSRELAFLANCLMAGCSVQARAFTAEEASDGALATCELAFERWPAGEPSLLSHDLVTAFQVGWRILHEMSLSVADDLISLLTGTRFVDGETQNGLDALRRELIRQRRAGTPWRARDALDVIAILDMPAWTALLGVLDECPMLPAALRASLEGWKGAVSATAFEFISSADQIASIRAFVRKLPTILSH